MSSYLLFFTDCLFIFTFLSPVWTPHIVHGRILISSLSTTDSKCSVPHKPTCEGNVTALVVLPFTNLVKLHVNINRLFHTSQNVSTSTV